MTHNAALMELIELVERLADNVYTVAGCAVPELKALRDHAWEIKDEAAKLYVERRDSINKGLI